MRYNTSKWVFSSKLGGIAQLVERLNGIQKVSGSRPLISTKKGLLQVLFFYFSVEISIRRKVRKIYNNYLKNEKLSKQIAKIKKTIEYSQRLFQNI